MDAEYYLPIYVRTLEKVKAATDLVRPLAKLSVKKSRVYWGIAGLDYPPSGKHIPYIRPNEVDDDGWVEYANLKTIDRHWEEDLPKAVVQPGDLLVEVKGNARKVHIVRSDVPPSTFVSGSMYRFVPRPDVDVHYVWAYLVSKTCQTTKDRLMSNSIIKWINPDDICQLPIPLPPRPVQEYIGAKVRLAERCRLRARELYSAGYRELGEVLRLPDVPVVTKIAWWLDPSCNDVDSLTPRNYLPEYLTVESELQRRGAVPIEQILRPTDGISNGATPRGANYESHGIPFLRVQNIAKNYVDLSDVVFIAKAADEELKRSRIRHGDIIFTITGYPGNAAVATEDLLPLNINQHSVRLGLKPNVNPFFVAAFLNSGYGNFQVQQRASGATRDALNYGAVKSIKVLLPDHNEQSYIGRYFELYGRLWRNSSKLVSEAKADVEALIEGRLDVGGILSGRIQPPTWAAIANAAGDITSMS